MQILNMSKSSHVACRPVGGVEFLLEFRSNYIRDVFARAPSVSVFFKLNVAFSESGIGLHAHSMLELLCEKSSSLSGRPRQHLLATLSYIIT